MEVIFLSCLPQWQNTKSFLGKDNVIPELVRETSLKVIKIPALALANIGKDALELWDLIFVSISFKELSCCLATEFDHIPRSN
jgi:hypothetical protein